MFPCCRIHNILPSPVTGQRGRLANYALLSAQRLCFSHMHPRSWYVSLTASCFLRCSTTYVNVLEWTCPLIFSLPIDCTGSATRSCLVCVFCQCGVLVSCVEGRLSVISIYPHTHVVPPSQAVTVIMSSAAAPNSSQQRWRSQTLSASAKR